MCPPSVERVAPLRALCGIRESSVQQEKRVFLRADLPPSDQHEADLGKRDQEGHAGQ